MDDENKDLTGTVTISVKEYADLLLSQEFLRALEAFGPDNWGGYGEVIARVLEDE